MLKMDKRWIPPVTVRRWRAAVLMVATAAAWSGFASIVQAQPDSIPADQAEAVDVDAGGKITVTFPENTPLTTLVAYVSKSLGLNILYDEALVNQRFTLRTPAPIPQAVLLTLLNTVLRSRNMSLQETDTPGLLQITPAHALTDSSRMIAPKQQVEGVGAITQVFVVENAQVERVHMLLMPFLSKPGGNVTPMPEQQILIVTDYPSVLKRVAKLIEWIDTPRSASIIRTLKVEHGDAADLLLVLQPLMGSRVRHGENRPVQVFSDPRTNQLVFGGTREEVEEIEALAALLDKPVLTTRRVYRPVVISPDRLDSLIKQILGSKEANPLYRAAVDTQGGVLVVCASQSVHEQIVDLLQELDVPPAVQQEPVRFYKLTNTVAADVLATIRDLEGDAGFSSILLPDADVSVDTVSSLFGRLSQTPPAGDPLGASVRIQPIDAADNVAGQAIVADRKEPRRATVAADANSNSIIVIAPPAEQRIYAEIIAQIDKRRPQVLIETTIVSLDTSDSFTLGVDVATGQSGEDGQVISFGSFGISMINAATGGLAPVVAQVGTFALLTPDAADIVVRALSTDSHARLVSMPRILVNDNQEGSLDSVSREPFERTVVVDGGSVITGEGDTAEAGTRISVTPHISKGDYLQIEYDVELSSFTGQRQQNLPPPSQTNNVASHVTIPDGHTIVVGGLNRQDFRNSVNAIPLLGDIPLLKHLFRSETKSTTNTTLFVFIRPTIMRDDQFRDLKYVSALDLRAAELQDNYPDSQPLLIQPAE